MGSLKSISHSRRRLVYSALSCAAVFTSPDAASSFGVSTKSTTRPWSGPNNQAIANSRQFLVPELYATKRRGARNRQTNQGEGFGSSETSTGYKVEHKEASSIYSLPALYDLAFGYRNFQEEVEFLLSAHAQYSTTASNERKDGIRILELAAGPARHCLTALSLDTAAESATAVDCATDMVEYGLQLAKDLLSNSDLDLFHYKCGDMREFQSEGAEFDTVWILLGSLQHLTTNSDVFACFRGAYASLTPGGTMILELPHPRETFSMVQCTRNGWEVPLEDDEGNEYGELHIVWGDDNDDFDPISQVRQFTVSMELTGDDKEIAKGQQRVNQVVPMRLFTAQEIDALALCSGFEVAAMYGALAKDVSVDDDDDAFRLVCVLRKA